MDANLHPFFDQKSIKNPLTKRQAPHRRPKTRQDAPKTLPRRAKTLPRRPKTGQDASKTPQDAPRRLPRRPQDEAQGEPGAEKIGPDLGSKSDLQRTRLQSSIFERFGMDFGRVLGWFRGAIEIDFSWILRVISQVRKARLISRSWLAADPVVARVSREAA